MPCSLFAQAETKKPMFSTLPSLLVRDTKYCMALPPLQRHSPSQVLSCGCASADGTPLAHLGGGLLGRGVDVEGACGLPGEVDG